MSAPGGPAAYDVIGQGYSAQRRADPRIAARIVAALGDTRRVLNVGAGTGSYEPSDRMVVAVEPSEVMIAQRGARSAPVVRGVAEQLPFPDRAFDAVLAVLTIHHWSDHARGLHEMQRIAPRRVALVFDSRAAESMWLWGEYLPEAAALDSSRTPTVEQVVAGLGADRVEVVPVPHDCADGFGGAYWRRPERYLHPDARHGISSLAALPDEIVGPALVRLRDDLASGLWHERHSDLLILDEIDLGYRLVIADAR